jgi:Fe2+ transport system protein B
MFNARMLYYKRFMKKLFRPVVIITIGLLLALFSAAMTYAAQSLRLVDTTGAALFFQTTETPPPQEEDKSEVGSTDGIVIMGGVTALIIIVPILARRKSWMRGA